MGKLLLITCGHSVHDAFYCSTCSIASTWSLQLPNMLFLKKQFFRMEMKESTTIETHLKQMKELSDQLAVIGAPVTEEDQVVTLLGNLPKSFSTLVTALEARVDEGLSLKYVQQALVNEEQKMREHGHSSGSDTQKEDSALVGDQSKRRPRSGKPTCYGCGQPGHFRRDCPNQKKSSHEADTAQHDTNESDTEGGSAFSARKDNSQAGKWFVDSGASSHMTWNQKLLTDHEEFEIPEKVRLGDGRIVDAVGIGNVYLTFIYLTMWFKVSEPKKSVTSMYHNYRVICSL